MEMHQIRYFMALCESLNFTRAAEYCNVTQPSLTRAIKVLENEVGGQLFHRERGNIHLTELGALLRPHLEEVMAQSRTAQAKAAGMLSLGKARLKLGLSRGVAIGHIEAPLVKFASRYPGIV